MDDMTFRSTSDNLVDIREAMIHLYNALNNKEFNDEFRDHMEKAEKSLIDLGASQKE